jgi:hypothetical protein
VIHLKVFGNSGMNVGLRVVLEWKHVLRAHLKRPVYEAYMKLIKMIS